jgi:glycogen(starch) synthase
MRVVLILPDSIHKPMGGMGVQAIGLMEQLPDVFFEVVSPDSDYSGGPNWMVHPYFDTMRMGAQDPLDKQICEQPNIMESVIRNIILKGKMPDIIHSFDWSTSHGGMALARALGRPHVTTIQLSLLALLKSFRHFYTGVNYNTPSALEIQAMTDSDAVVHVSYEYLAAYGILNPHRSFYMPNGIDLDKWLSVPSAPVNLPGRPNAKKLCYIGRYAEMKNIEGIVWASIPDDVDLYFIGSERGGQPQFFDLMKRRVDEGTNAYYLGPIYGDDKIRTLRAMDALIVPSHHEPFGIVALEALASGCTLLSSFQGGMGEYLTDELNAINCGTTPESITQAIAKWHSLDAAEIQAYKDAGIQLCQEYSWKRAAENLREIYSIAQENYAAKTNAEATA